MDNQKNEKFFKNGKSSLNNFKKSVDVSKLCHDTICDIFPIMEFCCDETLWKSQQKCSLNLIFKVLTMR